MDFDTQVMNQLGKALEKVLESALGTYNGPLQSAVTEVVLSHKSEIKQLLNEAITQELSRQQFRDEIKSAFIHSLARNLMKDFSGEVDKQANEMRRSPEFKARVVMAIEHLTKEYRD